MKVKELLKDENCWTQYKNSRDKYGEGVDPDSNDACCWCLAGAMIKVYGEAMATSKEFSRLTDTAQTLFSIRGLSWDDNYSFVRFNDNPNTTFEDVKKVVELADI